MAHTSKYDKSEIMQRAWRIYRKHNHKKSWSASLKESWAIAKGRIDLDFNKIYADYSEYVTNYIRQTISDSLMVEEIVQDTFLKVADNLHIFDSKKSKISTWIINIAKNVRIDHIRKDKSDTLTHISDYTDDNGNEYMEFSNNETADQLTMNEQLSNSIDSAMYNLKPQYREIATLFFKEGYKYEEIADILDIPLNSVRSNISRARAMLQNQLDNVRV